MTNYHRATNRRLTQRSPIAIAVRMRVGRREYLCQASDISADGIFLAQVKDGAPACDGKKCWLEFSLPSRPDVLVAARGVVLRQREHDRFLLSAVRFASIAPSHKRLVKSYVDGPPLASRIPAFMPVRLAG